MDQQKKDFSKGSVAKNILSMALPMTVAQLVNILYNVVDRMYIGHIPDSGKLELAGLGLALPIISIIMGFANLCGVGGGPLCSIHRGRGDLDEAEQVMGNAFTMLLILGAVIPLVFLPLREPLLYFFGASDATYGYARDYITICMLGTPFVMIGLGLNPMINAQGFSGKGMMTVLLGAVVNIVLDPILIFKCDMGIQGAAWATVVAQAVSAVWVLKFLTGRKATMRLRLCCMRPAAARVRKIVSLGLAGFFVNLTNSLVQVVCNKMLYMTGGDLYVTVMTAINSIREVTIMVVHGLNNGAQPVMGYNYGARCYSRVRQAIRFSAGATIAYSCLVWLAAMFLPEALIRIFNNDPAVIAAGVPALRIYFSMYAVMSLQISGQGIFVGLGRSKNAIFFSLLRKAVINAPLTVVLAYAMGTQGVFIAEAVSQFVGGAACFTTMYFTVYRPLKTMRDGDELPAQLRQRAQT